MLRRWRDTKNVRPAAAEIRRHLNHNSDGQSPQRDPYSLPWHGSDGTTSSPYDVDGLAGAFFVFTSNVDAHSFDHFDANEIRECHGNTELWQCSRPCTTAIWRAPAAFAFEVNKETMMAPRSCRAPPPSPEGAATTPGTSTGAEADHAAATAPAAAAATIGNTTGARRQHCLRYMPDPPAHDDGDAAGAGAGATTTTGWSLVAPTSAPPSMYTEASIGKILAGEVDLYDPFDPDRSDDDDGHVFTGNGLLGGDRPGDTCDLLSSEGEGEEDSREGRTDSSGASSDDEGGGGAGAEQEARTAKADFLAELFGTDAGPDAGPDAGASEGTNCAAGGAGASDLSGKPGDGDGDGGARASAGPATQPGLPGHAQKRRRVDDERPGGSETSGGGGGGGGGSSSPGPASRRDSWSTASGWDVSRLSSPDDGSSSASTPPGDAGLSGPDVSGGSGGKAKAKAKGSGSAGQSEANATSGVGGGNGDDAAPGHGPHDTRGGNHPTCPKCLHRARPAILMFNDMQFLDNHAQKRRWQKWRQAVEAVARQRYVTGNKQLRIAIVEVGCGGNVPTVRTTTESFLQDMNEHDAICELIRINPDLPLADNPANQPNVISIMSRGLRALSNIDAKL